MVPRLPPAAEPAGRGSGLGEGRAPAAARHYGVMPAVTPAPDLAARLAPLTLPEADGGTVELGSLWAEQPLLLVHLRHFG